MTDWSGFFQGELSAAAALAGLLFVAISVNRTRILELGRTADRAMEAFIMLFLIIVVASLSLIPNRPLRLLGGEFLALSTVTLCIMAYLQRSYMRNLDHPPYRRTKILAALNLLSIGLIAAAGLVILLTGDETGLYILPTAILMSFANVGANAWVLLIEISR